MTDKIAHARQDSSKNWHSHPLQKHLQTSRLRAAVC